MSLATPTQIPERTTSDAKALKLQRRQTRRLKLFEPALVRMAAIRSFAMLDPRNMARNPVMFLVEVGWVLTTIVSIGSIASGASAGLIVYQVALAILLLLTVLFANFAEALAEARGKAQAQSLRATRQDTMAVKQEPSGETVTVSSTQLTHGRSRGRRGRRDHPGRRRDRRGPGVGGRVGDHRRERAGDPRGRRRPIGRDRRYPRPLRPDRRRGHRRRRRELPRPDDRPGRGRQPPEDAQRDRPDDHPRRVLDHLPDRHRNPLPDGPVLRHHARHPDPDRAPRLPDPDHHRRRSWRRSASPAWTAPWPPT